jgi:hypothetical protein
MLFDSDLHFEIFFIDSSTSLLQNYIISGVFKETHLIKAILQIGLWSQRMLIVGNGANCYKLCHGFRLKKRDYFKCRISGVARLFFWRAKFH